MEEERKIWLLKLSWKYTTFNILDVQMWSIFIFTIILSPFCLFIYFYFHIYLHICLFIYICLGYSVHVELRGQLVGVTSLFSFYESQESNSGPQSWWQAHLLTEPSCWPSFLGFWFSKLFCYVPWDMGTLGLFTGRAIVQCRTEAGSWVLLNSQHDRKIKRQLMAQPLWDYSC